MRRSKGPEQTAKWWRQTRRPTRRFWTLDSSNQCSLVQSHLCAMGARHKLKNPVIQGICRKSRGFQAVGVGFEPTVDTRPTPVFKTGAINRSATPPRGYSVVVSAAATPAKSRTSNILSLPQVGSGLAKLRKIIPLSVPLSFLGGRCRPSSMRAAIPGCRSLTKPARGKASSSRRQR